MEKTYQYDYFISYAHKDNESEDGKSGFVDEFVDKLKKSEEHKKMFGGEVSVFFDKDEIHSMSEWDLRIRSKLAVSRFFVVLLSPSYFQSEYCAREFDWWMQHEMHRRLLGEATAPMKIVTVEEIDENNPAISAISDDLKLKFPNWMKLLRQIQSGPDFDMRNLYRAKIDETLRALRRETKDKVYKQDIAEESPTNTGRYPDYNHNFVGRRDELSSLRRSLSTKSSVAISAVNGLGGIGKTELAITYGHTFAWDYGLGRVFAKCENQTSFDNVLLSCGIAEMYKLNLKGTNEQKISQLYTALTEKRKTIEQRNYENNIDKTLGTHLLLILDNVNQMDLISLEQLRKLPPYFHVIITTRESTSKLSHMDTESLDRLSEDESVELLSNLYSFKDNNEALAARKIAKLLDGFTLAVEITGSYLRQYRKDNATYQEQYAFLSKNLPEGIKEMVNDRPALQQHQTECISVVLQPTLSALADNSLKALKFASRMSPDAVALGWLPELVCADDHEGKIIRRQLTGYNLLTPLQVEQNIARIHRLVAESLDIPEDVRKEIINIIRAKCNSLLKNDEQFWSVPENAWNITPVSEFLKLLAEKLLVELKTAESSEEKIDWDLTRMMAATGKILSSRDKINEAYDVFHLCYIICKERYKSFPDNNDVFQNFRSSCDNLKNLLNLYVLLSEKERAAGNNITAQEYLEKSQKISQEIQGDLLQIRQELADIKIGEVMKYRKGYYFDFFISYSRADNQSEDGQSGFVDRFVEKMIKSKKQRQMFGGEIKVFFEKSEIHSMSEWDSRIRSGLASSRFLVVLISPNYFKSEFCAREFDWWMQHEMHRRTLGESLIPVLIDPLNDLFDFNKTPLLTIPQDLRVKYPYWGKLLQQILSSSDSYTHGFDLSIIDEALQSMQKFVKDKVLKQSLADKSPVNALYPHYNTNFVGRRDYLRSLREIFSTQSKAAICALAGLGGIGKTELALTYGHAFAWDYRLGRTFVNCEDATSLTDILLSCGIAEMNGWGLPRGTREQQLSFLFNRLKAKRDEIVQRNIKEGNLNTLGTHILLILDNVNKLELIRQENLDILPDYFHVIITTRKRPYEFQHIHSELVDRLSIDESVELLSNLRLIGSDPREAEAARNIAKILGGCALAVELTGMYLSGRPHVTYQSQYEWLVKNHGETFQTMEDKFGDMPLYAAETISVLMEQMLSSLSHNARQALKFASQMAPDAIGLGWLPELVDCNESDDNNFLEELTSCNLLAPLENEPNIARIHRLVAASVKLETPEEECRKIIAKIRAKCNRLLEETEQFWFAAENSWNIIPVSEFLKMLPNSWTVEPSDKDIDWNLTRMLNITGNILKNLGKIKETLEVYTLLYEICQKRVETMPTNVQASLDLNISYNNLGDLENEAGNIDAARTWFEKALEINKRLANLMPDNVNALRGLIVSFNNFGKLEKSVGNANVARERYESALEISERLANINPDNDVIRQDLLISYNSLGDLEKAVGNAAAALDWYKKALEIFQWLANKKPGDVGIQRNFGVIFKNFGDIEQAAGNVDTAREWYEKALEISKQLAEIMPENVGVQEDWSFSIERLGNLEYSIGNAAVAKEWYDQALVIRKRVVDLMPDNVNARRALIISYERLGDLEKDSRNAAAARERYEKALEISKRLAEMMPEDVEALRGLSITYHRLGDLENAVGNVDTAREWYEKTLEISKRLAEMMPEDINVKRDLSITYNCLGDLEKDSGNLNSARFWYEKALEIALEINKRLAEMMPEDINVKRDLSITYHRLGDLERASGNAVDAREWYMKALNIDQRLAVMMPEDVNAQRDLSITYNRLGNLESAAKNVDAARSWYEKALNIDQRLADMMPEDVNTQRDLSITYNRLGDLEKDSGNVNTARLWYEKTLEISKRLAEMMPEDVNSMRVLSITYNNLGDLEKTAGNDAAAREWYKKGMDIFQHIDKMM